MRALQLTSAALLLAGCSGTTANTGKKTNDQEQEPIVYEDMPDNGDPAETDPVEEPPPEEPPAPPAPPDLHGSWTGACEAGADGNHRLSFAITEARWDLQYELFGDATCAKRKAAIHLGGTYEVLDASETVPGAWNATFSFDARDLTADDAKTAKALGKACGVKLKAKKAADIHAKGCPKLGLKPADACAADHDLVAIERDRLFFGVRPADNDMCTEDKRPTALVDAAASFAFDWPTIGLAECDGYVASARSWVACDKIPAADARGLFDGVRITAEAYAAMTATADPETKQQMADSCKQGDDATKQALAASGCATP